MWWFLCKRRRKGSHFPKTSITVASVFPKTAFGLRKLPLMVQVFVESIHHIESRALHINSPVSLAGAFSSRWQCKVNIISNRCTVALWIRKRKKKLALAGGRGYETPASSQLDPRARPPQHDKEACPCQAAISKHRQYLPSNFPNPMQMMGIVTIEKGDLKCRWKQLSQDQFTLFQLARFP